MGYNVTEAISMSVTTHNEKKSAPAEEYNKNQIGIPSLFFDSPEVML
jgi:hypothetical protein